MAGLRTAIHKFYAGNQICCNMTQSHEGPAQTRVRALPPSELELQGLLRGQIGLVVEGCSHRGQLGKVVDEVNLVLCRQGMTDNVQLLFDVVYGFGGQALRRVQPMLTVAWSASRMSLLATFHTQHRSGYRWFGNHPY